MGHSADTISETQPQLSNPTDTIEAIERCIEIAVTTAGKDGVVVNLSGGIDSTVTASLAVRALGSDRVTGLILPAATNSEANIDDARQVAEELVIDTELIEIQPLLDAFLKTVTSESRRTTADPLERSRSVMTVPTKHRDDVPMALGNAAARLRMLIAYFEANTTNSLVLGTGNLTELQLGYFTKYGDGACDLLPIGDLYKSEVKQVAKALEVRSNIIEKQPTAGLLHGQDDESELGAPYAQIDTILWNLQSTAASPAEIASQTGIARSTVERILTRIENSTHKRTVPQTASELVETPLGRS